MGFETPNKEGEGSRLLIRKGRVRDSKLGTDAPGSTARSERPSADVRGADGPSRMSDMRSVKYARCRGDDGDGGRAVVESMGELSPQFVLAGLGPAAAVAGESASAQGGSG